MEIADGKEVLEFLTYVMRREDEEEIKFSDSFKAAELLGKHHGLFSDKRPDSQERIIIIDDIGGGNGEKTV